MAGDIREQVTEWLTGVDTCFLIGAGCSVCAEKPLIGELTERVLKTVDEKLRSQFDALKTVGDRAPTIEDLMTYLARYRDVLGSLTKSEGHSISIEEIEGWLATIKQKIVTEIADDWRASDHHQRFLQRIRNPRQGRPRDIFSLNYDTVIEASLDELRLPYLDGFRGTNRAWFDPDAFEDNSSGAARTVFRVFKLHGSINWTRDDDGYVRRGRTAKVDTPREPIVVYPSEQKYLQTQYGIFESIMGLFRNRLRATGVNNCLVVLGYSFNDEHINEAICDAVNARGSNLTVVSFVGPDKERHKQIERLSLISKRCDNRFNAFIGDADSGHFVGHALDADDAALVLGAGLWRFETLVNFIAGESQ